MWLCNKEKTKLVKFTYLPDPREGFKYATIRAIFSDGDLTDDRSWGNDAMLSEKALKALVVFTAFMVDNDYGFSPICTVYNSDLTGQLIKLYHKKAAYDKLELSMLEKQLLPNCILEAIVIICEELEHNYGTVDYLDT